MKSMKFVSGSSNGLDLYPIAYSHFQYHSLISFNSILCFFRLFKYSSAANRLSQLTNTLHRASGEIVLFLPIFIIIILSFGISFYLAFGVDVFAFRSLTETFVSLSRSLIGDFDFLSIQQSNRFLGPLLFVTYTVVVFFILLNMFLAIINDSYMEERREEVDRLKGNPDVLGKQMNRWWGELMGKWKRPQAKGKWEKVLELGRGRRRVEVEEEGEEDEEGVEEGVEDEEDEEEEDEDEEDEEEEEEE